MPSFALQCFEAVVAAANQDEAVPLVLANPVLLSETYWPEFRQWSAAQPPGVQDRASQSLGLLSGMRDEAQRRWQAYPFGPASLDQILRRALAGELNLQGASDLAAALPVVQNLSPVYVRARLMQAVLQARDHDWRDPLLCHRIIIAAIQARKSMFTRDQPAMESIAAIEFAYIAKAALADTADARFLHESVALLNAIQGVDPAPWNSPGAIEYAFGQLYLDPYIYRRTSASFQQQIDAWMRLPFETLGPQWTDALARETKLPSPVEAFTEASRHFLAAANLESGPARGANLKGYIEAETWKQIAGGKAADLSKLAAEAIALLPGDRYTELRAAIDSLVHVAGQTVAVAEDWQAAARDLLAAPLDQRIAREGVVQTTELMIRVAEAVGPRDRTLAFQLWRKALPWMARRDELARDGFLRAGIQYLTEALAAPIGAPLPPAEKQVAELFSRALRTQPTRNEKEGLHLVETARAVDPSLAHEWSQIFDCFTALLHNDEASNCYDANDYPAAIRSYTLSALYFLQIALPHRASQALDDVADLIRRSPAMVEPFATDFALVIPELDRQGGNDAVSRVRDLGRVFMPLVTEHGGIETAFLLLAALKGAMFSAAWQKDEGSRSTWIDSAESRELLQNIDAVRRTVPGGGVLQDLGGLDLDDLLTVFAEETETASGAGPDSVLHNLEVRYDRELRRHSARPATDTEIWRAAPGNIAAALGPETVLLDLYSGVLPNGHAGLYRHIVTAETAFGRLVDLGMDAAQVRLGRGDGFAADILAPTVSAARRALRPDRDPAEALPLLAQIPCVSGQMGDALRKFREQGKWHLCIVPHGPLHFFPFHLLPYGDGLLADEWAITCLPALGMLAPRAHTTSARPRRMASFGLEFRDGMPHGLPEIQGSEDEARAVAACFGEQPILGPAATETALSAALATAQRIHISTHGLHAVSAPAFQRVYLTPDAASDGVLYAWELLKNDCRGVDLLTLSACETALGRIDKGDNLRGLAANALTAGAATVIGTLWPVGAEVTKQFFESFYTEIAGDSGKREAFQSAQLTVRQTFPAYRDWGAFWYAGLW